MPNSDDVKLRKVTEALAARDAVFLRLIREMREVGYGRMIQIIGNEWDQDQPGAGFIHTNGIHATDEDRARFYALRNGDPLRERAGWDLRDENGDKI